MKCIRCGEDEQYEMEFCKRCYDHLEDKSDWKGE